MEPVASSSSVAILSAALHTLQQIPGQLSAQAKAAAEARLEQLIQTYRELAPIADPQTLAFLANQIGIAARALGDTAAAAPTASTPAQTQSATAPATPAQGDTSAKTILVQAGTVIEAIRRRLAFAATAQNHPAAVKAALTIASKAARAVADALTALGGPVQPEAASPALNLVA